MSEKMLKSVLLHLGMNMWDDYMDDPDGFARSDAELAAHPNPVGPGGKRPVRYRSYVRTHGELWRKAVDHAAACGCNAVFVDLGEACAYPSHPELAVTGTWSVGKVRAELARMRTLGLEPLPKLNFSSCHDGWLKDYGRMLSTPEYYKVVSDVIRDVAEIFDRPRLFHIGYDEEMPAAAYNNFHMTIRQGDLWWHDVNYTIGCVEKQGARPVMWADAMWVGRAEYVRRMSREVLQSNWYYHNDFSERKRKWDSEFEKKGGWGEGKNGVPAFLELEKAGFDQLPCGSDWWGEEGSIEGLIRFCREQIAPERLKGFCLAPWGSCTPDTPEEKNIGRVMTSLSTYGTALRNQGC